MEGARLRTEQKGGIMSDIVRLHVDKATREVLDQLCDHLDSEPGWAARLRSDLARHMTSESDVTREHCRRISDCLADLGVRTAEVAETVSSGLSEVGRRLDEGAEAASVRAEAGLLAVSRDLESIRSEIAETVRRTETAQAGIEAVAAGTDEGFASIRVILDGLTEALGRQQVQVAELSAAVERLSRPWWKKVFGG